ncbi:MAG: hypothetical protein H7A36_02875 [Chlamydiales bacterium]|nr:hypothetical protein [Chlamydiales bacterium]
MEAYLDACLESIPGGIPGCISGEHAWRHTWMHIWRAIIPEGSAPKPGGGGAPLAKACCAAILTRTFPELFEKGEGDEGDKEDDMDVEELIPSCI